MNKVLGKLPAVPRLFEPLPQRSNLVPKHVTLDTKFLRDWLTADIIQQLSSIPTERKRTVCSLTLEQI